MTAQVLEFIRPPKLGKGERPKRRTDEDRLAEMDGVETGWKPGEPVNVPISLIAHAKLGAPPHACEGCETQCSGCKTSA